MNVFYVMVSIALGLSLMLPRLWLHLVGVIGCSILLWHALDLWDPAFITIQLICVMANSGMFVHEALRRMRPAVSREAVRERPWRSV